jgi:arylsulfatase
MANANPNVLLITTDHWPGALLEDEGHPAILTPTLNAISREGLRFGNAYSECPVCVPARRCLMTGLSPSSHGVRDNVSQPLPAVTSLAQAFRDNGYQSYAVGKLHVSPQRSRIGFDEVLLDEEGRAHEGVGPDDYEIFLADHGHPGQRFAGGMNNNEYLWRPWHLDESLHVTNWASRQLSRAIRRRDPVRPGFWYLSFSHPHPPLAPLRDYLELYRDAVIPDAYVGEWAGEGYSDKEIRLIKGIRRAFYALCTHIDHQIRLVIGTLREEGLLDDTVLCFTSDHGEMLGNHRCWGKRLFLEDSARIPLYLWGRKGDIRVPRNEVSDRLVCLADIMPTLLDLADLPCPDHVEGLSMIGRKQRDYLFGEVGGDDGSRMIRKDAFKLIYQPRKNRHLLFEVEKDRMETRNLYGDSHYHAVAEEMDKILIDELKLRNPEWIRSGKLVGASSATPENRSNRGLSGQRGLHWPPPPIKDIPWA